MNNNKNTNRILPIQKNNRFYNHADDKPESFLFQTLPSFVSSLYRRKKRLPENKHEWIHTDVRLACGLEPQITWIGHSSFLIQIGGITILTDPVFGDASVFFPRILPPGIALSQLPAIDIVLLSHNHRDHCDIPSLKALKQLHGTMTILAPQGDKRLLEKHGISDVIEHTWWDTFNPISNSAITCTFLPAHHWSAQGIFDRNKSLWGSWMIHYNASSIYFAGDTAYSGHFKNIAQEFSSITVALMPIAPIAPHPWMRKSHMDAHEAVQAFVDLQAHTFVPMHWGTFQFGLDTFAGPLDRLHHAWNLHQLDNGAKKLSIIKIGQQLIL